MTDVTYWQMTSLPAVAESVTKLLACGWEPFDVTRNNGTHVWLRRRVANGDVARFVPYEEALQEVSRA